jgi:hypothetical protein
LDANGSGEFKDKTKVCADCDERFVFEAGEQEFYALRQMPETKRCPSCRKRRRKPIDRVTPEVHRGEG